ncbi:uncharacterized protein LOC120431481 [Culex pipiens pallens]|nr:uncharacterized protein LOC120431481 [Culex pipiens pallens]
MLNKKSHMRSSELRTMALRQKHQIDKQQQLLAAREQRLRFLKTQEANETAVTAEGERLRRLRERVEAQESKLRRLRALRGQVDLQKTYNVSLGNDLDSIRALFSEKEKELTLAVAKVEALTRQLEELRRNRRGNINYFSSFPNHSAAIELENLRSELMYRNKLSLQQDARLHLQRDALQKRQAELQSVDQRILELQGRLNKKRSSHVILNHSNSNNNAGNHVRSVSSSFHSQNNGPRNNVVAVGPFNHFPEKIVTQGTIRNKTNVLSNSIASGSNCHPTFNIVDSKSRYYTQAYTDELDKAYGMDYSMAPESDEHKLAAKQNRIFLNLQNAEDSEYLNALTVDETINSTKRAKSRTEHELSQMDQEFENDDHVTNRKPCTYNDIISESTHRNTDEINNECDSDKVCDSLPSTRMKTPVYSIPLLVNRSVAISITTNQETISDDQHVSVESSQFYPKTLSSKKPGLSANCNEKMIHMVVPQTKITDISTSMESTDKIKPALPPKPLKQNVVLSEADTSSEVTVDKKTYQCEHSSQFIAHFPKASCSGSVISDGLPIKARPLTIKKSPYSEHPRLKHFHIGMQKNQLTAPHRAIEMPQTYGSADKDKFEEQTTEMSLSFQTSESDKQGESANLTNKSALCSRTSDEKEDIDVHNERAEGTKHIWTEETTRRKRSFVPSVASDGNIKFARRVSFDPLALLLDASLEGELELVKITASQVSNPSAANDEGITALHNAICAGHVEIVK